MKSYSKEELIKRLQWFSKELGKTPTTKDLMKNKKVPSYLAFYNHFGSWNNALRKARLKTNYEYKFYSKKELINLLIDFENRYNRSPKMDDFQKDVSLPAPVTYIDNFGSWNAALSEAGLKINVRKDYTNEELLELLKKKAKELRRSPFGEDINEDKDMPNRSTYDEHFGSWNAALSEAGLKINAYYRKWTKEEVIKWLQYKYDELGKTPGIRDFDKDPRAPAKNTVRKLFGNWTNALREAKIPVRKYISKKELIGIMKKLARKLNRTPTRSDMNETKGFPSYTPFVEKFGSYTAACLSAGLIPNDGRNNKIWQNWQKHCEENG